jgi:hypothetical protein
MLAMSMHPGPFRLDSSIKSPTIQGNQSKEFAIAVVHPFPMANEPHVKIECCLKNLLYRPLMNTIF